MTGILLLDERGTVRFVNPAAGAFWRCEPSTLVDRPFVSLFAFEVVSDDPEMLEAQWEVLLASASDQRVPLAIQPDPEAPSTEVRVGLEATAGGTIAWIARIELAARVQTTPPFPPVATHTAQVAQVPPGAGGANDVWTYLAHSDAAGFFDLNFVNGETYYSPAWKRLLGYAEADLVNTYDTWIKLLHPDDTGAAPDQVGRHTRATQRTYSVEFRMKHRRGHWVWIQSAGVQIFGREGELQRVVGFHLDISDRKEIEEQGIVAEDRLAQLAEEGGLAVFDLDFITGHAWVSGAWRRLVGDPVEHPDIGTFTRYLIDSGGDLTGFLAHFVGDDPWAAGFTTLRRSDHSELSAVLCLQRRVSRRGELLRVIGFALPAPTGAPRPSGASLPPFAVARAGSDEIDPAVLDAVSEGVILADHHGRILHLNTKAVQLLGLPPAAAKGQPLEQVFKLTNPDGSPAADALELALESETVPRPHTEHALNLGDDRPPRPLSWSVRQLRGEDGGIAGLVLVFRDPDEMSLTPEELIRANRFDSLGQLAGGIAHDFNNLLSTILGGISIAKDNRDYEKLNDAETACMTAKTLTRQLLAFAKGNPGGTYTVARPADILRDAVRVASAGSPVKVLLEADERAGPVEVDRGQMIQVYQNLIINAMQAMPDPSKGVIRIRCRTITLGEDQLPPLPAGDCVQIEVQDNGSGIPEDKIDRIFEPFFTTKKTGTGLGLATVLSIIRRHGGQLGVDSTVGVGTTFSTFLPTTTKSLETSVRKAASLRYGTGRVLLMDDDPQLCEITKSMLQSLDYKVDVVHHGEDALTHYRRYHAVNRPYDVVLLDLTIIGGMGGEEAFKRLKEIDPDVRAVVSSGYDNDEMARHFLEAGFCGYLTKPYRVAELGRMLKSVLGG